jgi:hypothetical protein
MTNWKHGVVYIGDTDYLGETQILSLSSNLILVQATTDQMYMFINVITRHNFPS